MARTINTIFNEIIAAKEAEAGLSGLTSTSSVAIWRLWARVTATAIHFNERLWDVFKNDLEAIVNENVIGTPAWLKNQVELYQYGDTIQLIDFKPQYATIDTTKRIITRCAVKQLPDSRIVLVKVAKGTDQLVKLTPTELSSLSSYIKKIKFAGTTVNSISLDADKVQVHADVYYDGEYIADTVKASVVSAITEYFKTLEFDGVIYVSKIQDVIQAVEGVKDVVINSVKARLDTDPIEESTVVNRLYESYAGYLVPETLPDYTLGDTIKMNLHNQ